MGFCDVRGFESRVLLFGLWNLVFWVGWSPLPLALDEQVGRAFSLTQRSLFVRNGKMGCSQGAMEWDWMGPRLDSLLFAQMAVFIPDQ